MLCDLYDVSEMVDDAVRPAEAGGGDDFLVVDPLAAVAGHGGMRRVAFGRDRTDALIARHDCSSLGSRNDAIAERAEAFDRKRDDFAGL